MQRAIVSGELGEILPIIKSESNDDCLGPDDGVGRVSTTMALGISSSTNNTFGSNNEVLDCVVCGDRATGKKWFVQLNSNISEIIHFLRKTLRSDIM